MYCCICMGVCVCLYLYVCVCVCTEVDSKLESTQARIVALKEELDKIKVPLLSVLLCAAVVRCVCCVTCLRGSIVF